MLCLLFLVALGAFFFWRYKREQLTVENIRSKAVLVTGCDSGFGKAFALKCLNEGMPVFAACLTEKGKGELVDSTRLLPGRLHAFVMDVTNEESVKAGKKFVEEKCQAYKGLYGLVNNAGIASNTSLDDWLTVSDYRRVTEVNTFGVILVTQTFKDLIKKSRGRIVTTSSICGRLGIGGLGPYTVSKFAVEGYCDVIRNELANFGVKVSVIEPGFFRTPMTDSKRITAQLDSLWANATPETRAEYGEKYFKFFQTEAAELLDKFSSSHPEQVSDIYFHAISAVHPRGRYQVGWDAHLLFIPLSFLPAEIQTFLITSVHRLAGFPLPAVLEEDRIC